jgi:hypothetical protein
MEGRRRDLMMNICIASSILGLAYTRTGMAYLCTDVIGRLPASS